MSKVPANLKVCIFDVFGTVVDWRGSLIQDLPALGKKYGIDTDWTSFADDWRGLYQPQMGRVRKGELPWTRIDDLHKEAFEMLLQNRGLKHPGEEGAWEFTHLWHKLRPWPDSVEGIGMMKKKFVVATLSNGNVALLINMAKNGGIPWDHCFSGETFHHYKPDPEAYLGVVDSMYLKPEQVMLVARTTTTWRRRRSAACRPASSCAPPNTVPARPATSRPRASGTRGHVDDRSGEEAWLLIRLK
jgi:2-haloacid dehalogenase